jgi:transcriptional regulator of acetoin/glycerol metabolism
MARDSEIRGDDLGLDVSQPLTGREPDAQQVRAALSENNGVVAKAARALGMSRQALYRRMEKYSIEG